MGKLRFTHITNQTEYIQARFTSEYFCFRLLLLRFDKPSGTDVQQPYVNGTPKTSTNTPSNVRALWIHNWTIWFPADASTGVRRYHLTCIEFQYYHFLSLKALRWQNHSELKMGENYVCIILFQIFVTDGEVFHPMFRSIWMIPDNVSVCFVARKIPKLASIQFSGELQYLPFGTQWQCYCGAGKCMGTKNTSKKYLHVNLFNLK